MSPTAGAKISIDELYPKWSLVQYGQSSSDNSNYGLVCKDKNYFIEVIKIKSLSKVNGIGIDLIEVALIDKKHGIVLINDIIPGSNADKCGLLQLGDIITSVIIDNNTINVEGMNFDELIKVLGSISTNEFDIIIKRLSPRKEVKVEIVGPQGEFVTECTVLSGYGTNLRALLQSKNIKLYDERTSRFDSPYQTGNCGGDGTCGTCVVAVLEGKELLNEKVRVEDMALKKQFAPPNYRWSCRAQIAPETPKKGGSIKIKLRPQTTLWDYQTKRQQ
eukprot:gene9769-13140_t